MMEAEAAAAAAAAAIREGCSTGKNSRPRICSCVSYVLPPESKQARLDCVRPL
jgi:hypothetical protein